jgi:hypothetical protein
MIKTKFFMALHDVIVEEDLGQGIAVESMFRDETNLPEIYLTNNKEVVGALFNMNTILTIGGLETGAIQDAHIVCYSFGEFNPVETSAIEYLNSFLSAIKTLSLSLWFLKDCSADFEIGFLEYEVDGEILVSSNTYGGLYKKANGKRELTVFTKEELEQFKDLFERTEINDIRNSPEQTAILSDNNRIEICSYLLQIARKEKDLAIRIANYSTCFEALLTSDNLEISHKLSERIAFFLSDHPEKRLSIYKTIKKIYGVRSSVLHGSRLKDKVSKELVELSEFCDLTLRALLFYAYFTEPDINVFGFSQEKFEDHFLNLIMGLK